MTVLLSDNSAAYLSFANVLSNSLPPSIQKTVFEHPEQLTPDAPQADLIVAVGKNAAELSFAQTDTPVLAVMIPKISYEDLLAKARKKNPSVESSVIYLDQPWNRQLDFLHAALPDIRKIGLLYSADSGLDIASLRKNISQRGNSLVSRSFKSADDLFSSLENVLDGSDVLLAVPDQMIYSSSNIRNILLTSYRHRVPLIGLSQAYVNAGALCAIFSTPQQLAEQTGATVKSFAQTRQLPEPQYPADFAIALNQQLARSLGIELAPEETIRSQMNKLKDE